MENPRRSLVVLVGASDLLERHVCPTHRDLHREPGFDDLTCCEPELRVSIAVAMLVAHSSPTAPSGINSPRRRSGSPRTAPAERADPPRRYARARTNSASPTRS